MAAFFICFTMAETIFVNQLSRWNVLELLFSFVQPAFSRTPTVGSVSLMLWVVGLIPELMSNVVCSTEHYFSIYVPRKMSLEVELRQAFFRGFQKKLWHCFFTMFITLHYSIQHTFWKFSFFSSFFHNHSWKHGAWRIESIHLIFPFSCSKENANLFLMVQYKPLPKVPVSYEAIFVGTFATTNDFSLVLEIHGLT